MQTKQVKIGQCESGRLVYQTAAVSLSAKLYTSQLTAECRASM
jgi:hypothetical protein